MGVGIGRVKSDEGSTGEQRGGYAAVARGALMQRRCFFHEGDDSEVEDKDVERKWWDQPAQIFFSHAQWTRVTLVTWRKGGGQSSG